MDISVSLQDLGLRFAINAVAAAILIFGMFYRRHRDRDLAVTAAMFNIFAFAVLYKLSSVEFSLAAGFGLFAILALFNLRSEPIGRVQIAYFFGAVAIAVICSVAGTPSVHIIIVTGAILIGVYVVDHPAVLPKAQTIKVTLDTASNDLLSKPSDLQAHLSARLGVTVTKCDVASVNLDKDGAVLRVTYVDR